MTLNLAICDDNEADREKLDHLLTEYAFCHDYDFHIEEFGNGEELLTRYVKQDLFHILLIDIEMPGESGIDIAYMVKQTVDHGVMVVFVSNYPEYMQDSFKVHPYHFLQKPVSGAVISKLMDDILYEINYYKTLVTIIDAYQKEYTVNINDIYYIETIDAKNKELSFHLYGEQISAKGILTTWSNMLKDYAFHVCSRTVLVNLTHIHYINGMEIVLDNGEKIFVSKKNKKLLLSSYLNQIVSVKRRRNI